MNLKEKIFVITGGSGYIGQAIVKEIIPYIIGKDDGRIEKATITENGYFCSSYRYLNDYINS